MLLGNYRNVGNTFNHILKKVIQILPLRTIYKKNILINY